MTQQPNQALPASLRAGDALSFAVQTSLPSTSFVFFVLTAVVGNSPVRLRMGGTGGVAVDASGVATFALASTDTAAYLPGRYDWVCFSIDASGNRDQIASGKITVTPDVAGGAPVDPRTWNQRVLDNIKAAIEGKSFDPDVAMYKVGNREMQKLPMADLLKQQAIFEGMVRRERIAKGEKLPRKTVGVRFG